MAMLIDKAELPAAVCLYLSDERANYLGGRYVMSTWDLEALEGIRDSVEKEDLLKTRVLGVA